jgi:hypothetical protein
MPLGARRPEASAKIREAKVARERKSYMITPQAIRAPALPAGSVL